MQTTTVVQIDGLGATAANAHIEKALEAVRGVSSVRMDAGSQRAIVEHDGADEQELLTALRALGYDEAYVR